MKQLLVIAVALASVNAFATRARVTALGNSPHLSDTQTVYTNPADMFVLGGDYVTLETGLTAATSTSNGAEGMVVRSMGDAKLGLSLGHDSSNAVDLRTLGGVPAAVGSQQNPVEVSYGVKKGDLAWAGTLIYSNYKDKTAADQKEDTLGLRGGLRMGALDASLRLGIANNASTAAFGKFKGTLGIGASVGYEMDNMYFAGDVTMAGYKTENPAGTETHKVDRTAISATATSFHKKDGSEFFYGAGLTSSTNKDGATAVDSKETSLTLPVWMGFEVDAASWAVLRGSITQTVLINDSKTTAGNNTTVETSPGPNNTVVAVGAGLKFNKITLDGSLEGLSGGTATQKLNGNTLFSSVGLTYMF
jgi:hypothetical protein